MDNLPNEILERILTYNNLSLTDVGNFLQTCKYLRTTIQESNFIWKHVFTQRWPDLLSMINPEEVTDWFDEVRHFINLGSRIANMCAHMASCFHLVNTLFPRDFSEWKELAESRQFNDIYIAKHLSFLRREKCDINSISAVPCSTIGSLTLRYYADQVFHHFHQERSIREVTELLEIPEKFRTLERCAAIISRLLHPFENVKYEDIRKELDRLSIEAQEELQKFNPLHPLFAIAPDVQSSWKDQTFECNIFEKDHLLEILRAVNILLYDKYDFDSMHKDPRNYHDDDNHSYIDKVLSTGVGLPILLSIIYESVCRRLGVHCESLNIPQHFYLKTICSGFGGETFHIDPLHLGCYSFMSSSSLAIQITNSNSVNNRTTSHEVMLRMLDNLDIYFTLNKTKFASELKFIARLKIVLYPTRRLYLKEYSKHFRECTDSLRTITTFESLENVLFASCRSQDNAEKYFHDQPNPLDLPIFPIGSIVVVKNPFPNKGVIVGSTPYFVADNNWCFGIRCFSTSPKYESQTFYYVLGELGQKYYISKDNLIIDESPTPFPDDLLYVGKFFSHYFVNHYVPNEHMNTIYPNNEEYRLRHYEHLLRM